MQDEREPLGGRERVEHDEQREADRIGEQRLLLGIVFPVDAHHGLRQPAAEIVLAARAAAQHVERDARDHRRQPSAEVGNRVRVRPAQPQPRFLHRVVGLAERAQHPVRDSAQMRAVPLELVGNQVAVSHCHISSFVVVIPLTNEPRSM